jgi:hypothetical protein
MFNVDDDFQTFHDFPGTGLEWGKKSVAEILALDHLFFHKGFQTESDIFSIP